VAAVADSPQLAQALAYARHGWPVFPVAPGEKVPVTSRGFKDATTDAAQIRAWWKHNPDRNIGIATGWPGPDVVDVDNHGKAGNGFGAWNRAKREGLVDGPMAIVRTPGDGMHAYYAGTDQRSAAIASKHLDFRAAGGYVVAPHSTVGGKPYVVVQRQASTATVDFSAVRAVVDPQPERPAWQPPRHVRDGSQNLDHLVARMADQPEGNRNGFLHWAANRVLDHGQEERLPELANAAVAAGLPRREADRTIESARRAPRQDPHATPQPRWPVRLAPGRQAGPQPAARQEPARQEEPQRGRIAVLEADRDSPEDEGRPEASPKPARAHDPVRAARPAAAEPAAREPGREHQADEEPAREEPDRPFAQPEPEREREAGE